MAGSAWSRNPGSPSQVRTREEPIGIVWPSGQVLPLRRRERVVRMPTPARQPFDHRSAAVAPTQCPMRKRETRAQPTPTEGRRNSGRLAPPRAVPAFIQTSSWSEETGTDLGCNPIPRRTLVNAVMRKIFRLTVQALTKSRSLVMNPRVRLDNCSRGQNEPGSLSNGRRAWRIRFRAGFTRSRRTW